MQRISSEPSASSPKSRSETRTRPCSIGRDSVPAIWLKLRCEGPLLRRPWRCTAHRAMPRRQRWATGAPTPPLSARSGRTPPARARPHSRCNAPATPASQGVRERPPGPEATRPSGSTPPGAAAPTTLQDRPHHRGRNLGGDKTPAPVEQAAP